MQANKIIFRMQQIMTAKSIYKLQNTVERRKTGTTNRKLGKYLPSLFQQRFIVCLLNEPCSAVFMEKLCTAWLSELTEMAWCELKVISTMENRKSLDAGKGAARGGAEGAQAPPLAIRILMFIS